MLTYHKFHKFVLNVGEKKFNFSTDQLKVALTNTEPTAATDGVYADIVSPLATTNLDGATPYNVTTTSFTQTGGLATLILANLVLTATGSYGPFRYVVLYDDTATNKELIGYFDYGSSATLVQEETLTIKLNAAAKIFTIE
jgi:hypothetical protein